MSKQRAQFALGVEGEENKGRVEVTKVHRYRKGTMPEWAKTATQQQQYEEAIEVSVWKWRGAKQQ